MTERHGLVTLHGNPLTLTGAPVAVGDAAPDAELVDNNLQPFSLASLKGKVAIVAAVPSLDTPVCDLQTRRFNTEAASLGADVAIVTVSMDLPFAQKRWCGAAGIDRLTTVSDHKNAAFGQAFGVLIKELRLLARAVFVIDRQGMVRHAQIVKEIGEQPDFDAVLVAVKAAL